MFAVIAFAACHRSGTWVDDPRNANRAWGIDLPRGMVLRHSWYWRSPHFTREESYFFEIDGAPTDFAPAFAKENAMHSSDAISVVGTSTCFPRPAWFAPGPAANYESWSSDTGFVLRDHRSGKLFIYCCQL
jgi:hypothetical protein